MQSTGRLPTSGLSRIFSVFSLPYFHLSLPKPWDSTTCRFPATGSHGIQQPVDSRPPEAIGFNNLSIPGPRKRQNLIFSNRFTTRCAEGDRRVVRPYEVRLFGIGPTKWLSPTFNQAVIIQIDRLIQRLGQRSHLREVGSDVFGFLHPENVNVKT